MKTPPTPEYPNDYVQCPRTFLRQHMEDIMSEISEENYAAGWIDGLEFILWREMHKTENKFLCSNLDDLREIHELLDEWIHPTAGWIRTDEWRKYLIPGEPGSDRKQDG